MSDLIDRNTALLELSKQVIGDKIWACDVKRVVENLPSAERWIPCSEPTEDDRSVFIAYGSEGLKSCCIGFYDKEYDQWYEERNFFASPIYKAKYWCDMPQLPEGWYE